MIADTIKPERAPRLPWKRTPSHRTPHTEEWTVVVGPYELKAWRPVGNITFIRSVYLREAIDGARLFERQVNGRSPRDLQSAMVDLERYVEDQVQAMQLMLAGAARFEIAGGVVK